MPDEVIRQAEQATRELAAGEDKGPLHGIPVAIKEIIDVAGTTSPASANCCRPS